VELLGWWWGECDKPADATRRMGDLGIPPQAPRTTQRSTHRHETRGSRSAGLLRMRHRGRAPRAHYNSWLRHSRTAWRNIRRDRDFQNVSETIRKMEN
jgi:hypothetical protein